jgi:hypothetical protein
MCQLAFKHTTLCGMNMIACKVSPLWYRTVVAASVIRCGTSYDASCMRQWHSAIAVQKTTMPGATS